MSHHDALKLICKNLPEDYEPYGNEPRDGGDCSSGCVWFYKLAERADEMVELDWGVCGNPISHRCGLLTFEHQGCKYFETDREISKEDWDDDHP